MIYVYLGLALIVLLGIVAQITGPKGFKEVKNKWVDESIDQCIAKCNGFPVITEKNNFGTQAIIICEKLKKIYVVKREISLQSRKEETNVYEINFSQISQCQVVNEQLEGRIFKDIQISLDSISTPLIVLNVFLSPDTTCARINACMNAAWNAD